jgi:hypothetical protein
METTTQASDIGNRVTQMLGHYFMYNNKRVKVESFRPATSKVIIHTDLVNVPIDYADFDNEIAQFIPVESSSKEVSTTEAQLPVNKQIPTPSVITDNSEKLSTLIFENIDKINADPKNIAQASAVNEQVKSFIELGKTQIEMLRLQLALSNNGKR